MSNFEYTGLAPRRWITMDGDASTSDAQDRATSEIISGALNHIDGARLLSVSLNIDGIVATEPPPWLPIPVSTINGLPSFVDVSVQMKTPGGHYAHVRVWVPLIWNERFLGLGGGGNRPGGNSMIMDPPQTAQILSLPDAIRNGFSSASTDGGITDPRMIDWPLIGDTGTLDMELIQNWVHRSTHDMTVIGKAVTEAIHDKPPLFSYFFGGSGGGRQALMEAQRYPDDYQGIWSQDPVISYSKLYPAEFWPAMVMHAAENPMPPAKFEAFREAAVIAGGGSLQDGLNFVSTLDPVDVDPFDLIDTVTSEGVITEADASVMQQIWEGPKADDGSPLWFGLRPGVRSWGAIGLAVVADTPEGPEPAPFFIAERYLGGWIAKRDEWNWRDLTLKSYHDLFQQSIEEMAFTDTDDPNLSNFREAGGKLLLTHAMDDEVIPHQGSVLYFERVLHEMGGLDKTSTFARLFLAPGAGHISADGEGPGLTASAAMSGLMKWVEEGIAPTSFIAERWDKGGVEILSTRPIYPYPAVAQYLGSGDPLQAVNYEPSTLQD